MNSISDVLISVRSIKQDLANLGMLGESDNDIQLDDSFDKLITDSVLRNKTIGLFKDGHYARAVEEAYKTIDNLVKKKAGLEKSPLSGNKLMRYVFSSEKPVLLINEGNTQSEKDERLGYMDIMAGAMTGIRNPRAHDSDWIDTKQNALQLLVFANHLINVVRESKIVEKKNETICTSLDMALRK